MMIDKTKVCRGCGQELSTGEFWKNNVNLDKLNSKCKSCVKKDRHIWAEKSKQNRTDVLAKTCPVCQINKTVAEFSNNSLAKDGLSWECKSCQKIRRDQRAPEMKPYFAEYHVLHREERAARKRQKYLNEREQILADQAIYRKNNPELIKERHTKDYVENSDRYKSNAKQWRIDNPERVKATKAANYIANPEKHKKRSREYRALNPEKARMAVRRSNKKRLATDPVFALEQKLRGRIRAALSGGGKASSTLDLIGCTAKQLMVHLATYFPGLPPHRDTGEIATENSFRAKGLHVDHIRPCSSFDLSDPEQQFQCFHYTNLRPLWWYDNLGRTKKFDVEKMKHWIPFCLPSLMLLELING